MVIFHRNSSLMMQKEFVFTKFFTVKKQILTSLQPQCRTIFDKNKKYFEY